MPVTAQERIVINLDLEKTLSQVDLKQSNHVMSPSAEGVRLSELVAQSFKVVQP